MNNNTSIIDSDELVTKLIRVGQDTVSHIDECLLSMQIACVFAESAAREFGLGAEDIKKITYGIIRGV